MTAEEKRLYEEYRQHQENSKKELELAKETAKKIALLAPHKVGEVIEWVVPARQKNVGSTFNPKWLDVPERKEMAVLTEIEVNFWIKDNISYDYKFSKFKKDGGVSQSRVYPRGNYTWTGEKVEINM